MFNSKALLRVCFSVCLLFSVPVMADEGDVFIKDIQSNAKRFESLLNQKSDERALINFMHNAISHNADIHVSVDRPQTMHPVPESLKLSKEDYINSFVLGPRMIQNYHASITQSDFRYDAAKGIVHVKETLKETGLQPNPQNVNDSGQDFETITACAATYTVTGNEPLLTSSDCKTVIAFEQGV